jgi:hypothetical protein
MVKLRLGEPGARRSVGSTFNSPEGQEEFMEESIMVMEKSRPHLESLSKLASQLNQATDRYMNELREIEAELNSLNIGLDVELKEPIMEGKKIEELDQYQEPSGVVYNRSWRIAYGRYSHNNWALLIREYTVYSDERGWCQEEETPLLSASRELRIAAADRIPNLLKQIEAEIQKKLTTLAKVTDK